MFSILYILMLSNGVYYWEPVMAFEPPMACIEVKESLEYYYDIVLDCVEFRDA